METVQSRKLPTDETLTVAMVEEDFTLDFPDDTAHHVYRNIHDEISYKVDTRCYWPVSDEVRSKSFLNKSNDSALTRARKQ